MKKALYIGDDKHGLSFVSRNKIKEEYQYILFECNMWEYIDECVSYAFIARFDAVFISRYIDFTFVCKLWNYCIENCIDFFIVSGSAPVKKFTKKSFLTKYSTCNSIWIGSDGGNIIPLDNVLKDCMKVSGSYYQSTFSYKNIDSDAAKKIIENIHFCLNEAFEKIYIFIFEDFKTASEFSKLLPDKMILIYNSRKKIFNIYE